MKIEIGKYYDIRGKWGFVYTVEVIRKSWVPFLYLCTWEENVITKERPSLMAGYKWSWQFIAEVQ